MYGRVPFRSTANAGRLRDRWGIVSRQSAVEKIAWEKRTEKGRATKTIVERAEAIHADAIVKARTIIAIYSDLPDLYVNSDGVGHYEALLESMSLGSGQTSIFDSDGSAIVIHSTADDNMTDPAGNSGDRIACGVITKATAKKP